MTQEFFQFFEKTLDVFKETKKYTVLIDKISGGQKVPLMPINELRGTLFHLYKAVEYPNTFTTDLLEAKEHLYRSALDTYSILSSILIERIRQVFEIYDLTTITTVFPTYYTEITPNLSIIQQEISKIRSERNTEMDTAESFVNDKWNQIQFLLDIHAKIESMIPELEKYQRDQEKARKKDYVKLVVEKALYVLGGILIATAAYFLFPK